MSERKDIIDGSTVTLATKYGMIYSCKCGWVDIGHANPVSSRANQGAVNLWNAIKNETGERSVNGLWHRVTYEQLMGKTFLGKSITDGVSRNYAVRLGLSIAEKESVAFSIFVSVSMEFEKVQSMPRYAWYTNSGFSAEDLVSNILGFYRAVRPGVDYIKLCEPVSDVAARYLWDTYGGPGRSMNKLDTKYVLDNIVLFPCIDCDTPKSRKVVPMPYFLQSIVPAIPPLNFRLWNPGDPDLSATPTPLPIFTPTIPKKTHTVATGDTLSLLANRYLNDPQKWPLIWFENESKIGTNYNVLKPGMTLSIPQLPVPEATMQRAREVARNWKPGLNWR